MREGRKKEVSEIKQTTRQSNTAHLRQSHVHVHVYKSNTPPVFFSICLGLHAHMYSAYPFPRSPAAALVDPAPLPPATTTTSAQDVGSLLVDVFGDPSPAPAPAAPTPVATAKPQEEPQPFSSILGGLSPGADDGYDR